jgi:tetratricopeptide (TPR) repeat protein
MLNGIYKISFVLLAILVLVACGRKKNTFLNRNSHAVAAEFNALYNGGVAYDKGIEELSLTYRDNFWEILPVERIELNEDNTLPGESKDPNFNRAEEKAVKAIQKHAMYIDGTEFNPQIDEAYLLLGKSRYYDSRFIPAMDAFNFILDKYPTSNSINIAKIWKAKSNIRLKNEEVALENLQKMFEEEDLDHDVVADASAIIAQAYINLDSIPEALPFIKLASENVRNNELKGRYAYIKGQLYNRLGFKDSANLAFDEVIDLNRRSPRVYMIAAHISKAKNFDYDKEDRIALLELLRNLEDDRENRPYLDKIYNQMGEYYRNSDSIEAAVVYYNASIQSFTEDKLLQSINYQTLAEINFDNAEYKNAGSYYDSTLTNLVENTRQWRRIKKKRENLDDVIKYEDIATLNDSILRLAYMSEEEQLAFFTDFTSKLKAQAVADSIANVKEKQGITNNEFYKKNKKGEATQPGGKFYFYNSSTVSYGKQEFRKIWGDRKLADYWRVSSKKSTLEVIDDVAAVDQVPIAENEKFQVETYISRIPTDQIVIDSIAKDRNFAYYQLGLIYKEKFKEYGLAANRLEKLLSYSPEERLILPAKYNLHKIYGELNNEPLALQYKNDILSNHSDSRYAEILRNPNSSLATDESSPEFKYKKLYKDFEDSKYQLVIETCDEYITIYNGNDIIPKLELLKATALGRQQGYEVYKKALNFIALNYPNSDEGKQAQKIYSSVLSRLASKEFVDDESSVSFKLVYQYRFTESELANKMLEKLQKAIVFFKYDYTVSVDYYSPETQLVVVHGLNSMLGTRGFGQVLSEHKAYKVKKPFFEIATENYKIVQIHKNLSNYLDKEVIEPKESDTQK